eukprot:3794057-Pyramimonas_sp.AAC.1
MPHAVRGRRSSKEEDATGGKGGGEKEQGKHSKTSGKASSQRAQLAHLTYLAASQRVWAEP